MAKAEATIRRIMISCNRDTPGYQSSSAGRLQSGDLLILSQVKGNEDIDLRGDFSSG
jgi:hypothetical protein